MSNEVHLPGNICTSNKLFKKFQSCLRSNHSIETALVHVVSDLRLSVDAQNPSILIVLDLSATFDAVAVDAQDSNMPS